MADITQATSGQNPLVMGGNISATPGYGGQINPMAQRRVFPQLGLGYQGVTDPNAQVQPKGSWMDQFRMRNTGGNITAPGQGGMYTGGNIVAPNGGMYTGGNITAPGPSPDFFTYLKNMMEQRGGAAGNMPMGGEGGWLQTLMGRQPDMTNAPPGITNAAPNDIQSQLLTQGDVQPSPAGSATGGNITAPGQGGMNTGGNIANPLVMGGDHTGDTVGACAQPMQVAPGTQPPPVPPVTATTPMPPAPATLTGGGQVETAPAPAASSPEDINAKLARISGADTENMNRVDSYGQNMGQMRQNALNAYRRQSGLPEVAGQQSSQSAYQKRLADNVKAAQERKAALKNRATPTGD